MTADTAAFWQPGGCYGSSIAAADAAAGKFGVSIELDAEAGGFRVVNHGPPPRTATDAEMKEINKKQKKGKALTAAQKLKQASAGASTAAAAEDDEGWSGLEDEPVFVDATGEQVVGPDEDPLEELELSLRRKILSTLNAIVLTDFPTAEHPEHPNWLHAHESWPKKSTPADHAKYLRLIPLYQMAADKYRKAGKAGLEPKPEYYSPRELALLDAILTAENNLAPSAGSRVNTGFFKSGAWLIHPGMFPERLRTWLTADAGLANTSNRGLGIKGPARCMPNGSVTSCVFTEVNNFDIISLSHPSKSDIDSWSEAKADKYTFFTIHQVVLLACDELELYLLYKLSALLNPDRPDLWLQVSHLCHDHGCIRRTHFVVETAIENLRRNPCKLAKKCRGDGCPGEHRCFSC